MTCRCGHCDGGRRTLGEVRRRLQRKVSWKGAQGHPAEGLPTTIPSVNVKRASESACEALKLLANFVLVYNNDYFHGAIEFHRCPSVDKVVIVGHQCDTVPLSCFPYQSLLFSLFTMVTSGQLDLSLDGQEGRQLIRVILQFIMSDDPQLTSKSVKLLIRQFSQRKELIASFKQVRIRM